MRILTTIICLLFHFAIYAQTTSKPLRIDIPNAIGGSVSSVFKDVKFIKLETTGKSLFGKVEQLIITEHHFIIYDNTRNQILVFTRDGKYVSKIDDLPGAVKFQAWGTLFDKFSFDKLSNEIVIKAASLQRDLSKKIFRYNLEGELIRTDEFNDILYSDQEVINGHYLLKNKIANNLTVAMEQRYSYTLVNYDFGSPKSLVRGDSISYLAGIDRVGGSDFTTNYYSGQDYIIASSDFYDNKFYKINSLGKAEAFKLVFPAIMTVPFDFMSNKSYDYKRKEFLEKNPEIIYTIRKIYANDRWLSFTFYSYRSSASLFYSFKTGIPYLLSKITPDSLSYNLPVFGDWTAVSPVIYEDKVYTTVSSINLVQAYEAGLSNGKTFNGDGLKLMGNMTKNQNPIIVELTPKDNL